MILPVILSGGSGTRLWPLSRTHLPKQLMPMMGRSLTLLQATVQRLAAVEGAAAPIVVTNEAYRFHVAAQMQDAGGREGTIILEPCKRNTAPAVAVAALAALKRYEDPVLLVLPADHHIRQTGVFAEAAAIGARAAADGKLVTFGIVPRYAETGYGYIRRRDSGGGAVPQMAAHPVARFVEKPDAATAREYVASGDYFWNSGMFLFRASVFLEELAAQDRAMFEACRAAVAGAVPDLGFVRLERAAFERSPAGSIDVTIFEGTQRAVVIPLDCGWSDVGSWQALYELQKDADGEGNVVVGDVVADRTRNSYLHSTGRLVSVLGVENLAVIETTDAVLVASFEHLERIKGLIGRLKKQGRPELETHRKVHRPWGSYEGIDSGDRYQVKRLTVKPGQVLSLQKHYHRSEHWIVVRGTARVTCDQEEILLTEDQSTYIPLGKTHRLENPGKVDLELIEVQTGSYLGEDDIVRFEDVYGRGAKGEGES